MKFGNFITAEESPDEFDVLGKVNKRSDANGPNAGGGGAQQDPQGGP
jgi:hypothetical protein